MVTRQTVMKRDVLDSKTQPRRAEETGVSWTPDGTLVRETRAARPQRLGALLRVSFGLIWAIDAYFKWQPSFMKGLLTVLDSGASGQPPWIRPWFNFAHATVATQPRLWALFIALTETALAVALILGFARKLTYIAGAVWSLSIWATAEGFGHVPSGTIATDIGAGIAYAMAFLALLVADRCAGTQRYSVDMVIERRVPQWRRVAEVR